MWKGRGREDSGGSKSITLFRMQDNNTIVTDKVSFQIQLVCLQHLALYLQVHLISCPDLSSSVYSIQHQFRDVHDKQLATEIYSRL
jgi:hypothetical protein